MARLDQLALVAVVSAAGVLVATARGSDQSNVLLGFAALLLVALAAPTAVMLAVATYRFGRVESPATSVHAMVALAFAYVLATCGW